MAVLDARDKLHDARILASQLLVEVFDENIGILSLQVTTIVGDDDAIIHVDDIATEGEVVGRHFIADAGCLQRSTSFIHLVLVIAHDRAVGYFRTGMEAIWHSH